MQRRVRTLIGRAGLIAFSTGLAACAAQRPVLYPNPKFEEVGVQVAEREVDECLERAREYATKGGDRATEAARSTAMGAGAGAAVGAVGGAVSGGGAGQGAAIGAATGGTAGLIHGLDLFGSREPDPVYRNFVERCLSGKGYEVIGWK